MRARATLSAMMVCCTVMAAMTSTSAQAQRWEVRREVREGARSVNREKREAIREMQRCTTRDCARREAHEGQREVARERREARGEIRREVRENYRDQYWRNDGRWYRDGRYWNRDDYERRYYGRRDNTGDVLAGVAIGAAVIGVVAAIADDDKDDNQD
jgi:hypothetical protein